MSQTDAPARRQAALERWYTPRSRFGVAALAIFLCALVFNALTPLVADDWGRAATMTSVEEVLMRSWTFYFEWDGRLVNTVLGNLTFLMPGWTFDVVNSLAFLALMLLIYGIAAPKGPLSATLLVLTAFVTWLYLPAFGQVTLWQLGSAIYLWAAIQIFAIIWIFHRYYARGREPGGHPALRAFVTFIFGAVAGNAAQNGSGSAFLVISGLALATWVKHKSLPSWMITGVLGTAAGLATVVLAPGNSVRGDALTAESDAGLRGLLGHLETLLTRQFGESGWLIILVAVLYAVYLTLPRRDIHTVVTASLLTTASLAATLVMLAAPRGAASHRTFSFSTFFLIAAAVVLVAGIVAAAERPGLVAQRALAAGLGVMAAFAMVPALYDAADMWAADRERTSYVISKRNSGKNDVKVKPLPTPRSKYRADFQLGDVTADPQHWRNRGFAQYMEIRSVVLREPPPAR